MKQQNRRPSVRKAAAPKPPKVEDTRVSVKPARIALCEGGGKPPRVVGTPFAGDVDQPGAKAPRPRRRPGQDHGRLTRTDYPADGGLTAADTTENHHGKRTNVDFGADARSEKGQEAQEVRRREG